MLRSIVFLIIIVLLMVVPVFAGTQANSLQQELFLHSAPSDLNLQSQISALSQRYSSAPRLPLRTPNMPFQSVNIQTMRQDGNFAGFVITDQDTVLKVVRRADGRGVICEVRESLEDFKVNHPDLWDKVKGDFQVTQTTQQSIKRLTTIDGVMSTDQEEESLESKYPSGSFYWADDDPFTTDKLGHMIGCMWLAGELSELFDSQIWGSSVTFVFAALWEVKDAYYSWVDHGSIGGDGASRYDLIADGVGIILSWNLLDPIIEKSTFFDKWVFGKQDSLARAELKASGEPSSRSMWLRTVRLIGYPTVWIAGCTIYAYAHDDNPFPNGFEWVRYDGERSKHIFGSFNGEISLAIPASIMQLYRPFFNLPIRMVISAGGVYGYEALNATLPGKYYPFFGDIENGGWHQSHVNLGLGTIFAMAGWELIFHSDEAESNHITMTPNGLGMARLIDSGEISLSSYRGCGASVGFHGDFEVMIRDAGRGIGRLFR